MPSSRYLGGHLLEHSLKKAEFAMPAATWVALCTAAPTRSSTGSTITEANYTGYKRVSVAAAGWSTATAADPDVISNASAIVIPKATAGESTVTYFAICTAETAGEVLYYGALAESLKITSGLSAVEFATGELKVTAE
jgi:hypothetical protein